MATIPRGIEVLVKKASVDPEFRQLLLEQRGQAALEIGLELTEAERDMLSSMPTEQLEKIIDNTKIDPEQRKIFLGKAAKLMLMAVTGVGVASLLCVPTFTTAGISPDEVRRMQMERSSDVPDANDPNETDLDKGIFSTGMRVDRPPEPARPWLRLPSEQSRKQDVAREYVVRSGDSLWLIAAQRLGDGSRYKEILKLNPDLPQDGRDLTPGMVLVIPAE